jgi:hypothetical protein
MPHCGSTTQHPTDADAGSNALPERCPPCASVNAQSQGQASQRGNSARTHRLARRRPSHLMLYPYLPEVSSRIPGRAAGNKINRHGQLR